MKNFNLKFSFLAMLGLLLVQATFAQTVASVEPSDLIKTEPVVETETSEEADEAEEAEKAFQISGFVDAYFASSFNEQPFPTSFTETNNSFTLGMANVVLSREGKVGFVADIAVGPRAEVANGYSGTTLSAIKQLFVTYSPTEKLTFTAGNFGTHVGYEVIDAPANLNYSTSYMFSNGPFYHTGLKADFAVAEGIGLMAGVFNDTDAKIDEVPGKHFGAQLSIEKGDLAAYVNYIGGKDDFISADTAVLGNQIDLTATYQVSDAFGLGLNATTKIVSAEGTEDQTWSGAALYLNYAFSDAFTLAARGEYIADADGLILGAADNSISSFTLSGNFHIGGLTFIPEFRIDSAKQDVFLDADGKETNSNPAFILAAVYSF